MKARPRQRLQNRVLIFLLMVSFASWMAAQSAPSPSRWQAQYTQIYFNNVEAGTPSPGPGSAGAGLRLLNGASVTTDTALAVDGKASIRLTNPAMVSTDPAVVQLLGNTTYILQLKYRVLSYGSADAPLKAWFQPTDNPAQSAAVSPLSQLLKNAPATGTFSAGAQLADAASYVLNIGTDVGADIVIDDVTILKQDAKQTSTPPAAWSRIPTLPYPRLGLIMARNTVAQAKAGGLAEGPPYRLTLDQIEGTLAFADVIAGIQANVQPQMPDFIWRIRQLNPNAVILPYRFAEEENPASPSGNSTISIDYQFFQGVADGWYLRDSKGNYVTNSGGPIRFMNTSPFAPVVNGQTFVGREVDWLAHTVFPSGLWDGVYLSDLYATNPFGMPNTSNPALFDVDFNGDGIRETPAEAWDITGPAAIQLLQQIQNADGGQQLIMGNNGPWPEFSLAPYINGNEFECADFAWDPRVFQQVGNLSQAGWRAFLDSYRTMQATARVPRINTVMACGVVTSGTPTTGYSTPTSTDLQNHRLTMATTLLDDGFYGFDLHDENSAPLWMDEYSVDSSGAAVEDRTKKGYLGNALTSAIELTAPGSTVFQESFDNGTLSSSFTTNPGATGRVFVSTSAGDVISGSGSLILSNPDHAHSATIAASTNPTTVQFGPGNYLVTFDWRVLETLDWEFSVNMLDASTRVSLDNYVVRGGKVAGDQGTVAAPFTVPAGGRWTIQIYLTGGGGKVAIDNLQIRQGAIGPWRRDFEIGFVLVNPLQQPHTFSATDLAGSLNRTGIHRIKGTQAPEINNGQSVTGDLTLGAFDAIILLADRLNIPGCSYALNYSGQAFAAQGGTGTITITTGADCPWSVGALPTGVTLTSTGSGVGNGSITFQVLPNLGGGVSSSFTIADQTFSVEQSAASIAGLADVGSLGQVAAEGTWDFSLIGINLGASVATARFTFADNNGNPLMLPLTFPQSAPAAGPELASTIDRTLNPNAQIVMESTGPDNVGPLVGAGQLLSNGKVGGFGIFSNPKQHWNAVIPLETRKASKYILAFDNTPPLTTGLAIASLAAQATNVPVIIRDDKGTQIGNPTISLRALGHTSFMLNDPQLGYPVTNNKRGTIEFDAPPGGQLSVLGLRANGPALTTLPVLANVGTAGGSITHVAYNGGWTSAFYIVNTGDASAQFSLSFFDENGIALPVPLLLPQTGTNTTTSALTQTLAPGAMLVVNTNEQDSPTPVVGSAQLTTTGNIGGFEIFRWNTFNQEASVPLETRTPNSFVLVFDNTNGLTTGVALANLLGSAANITVTLRDDTGAPLPSMPINLPPRAHTSFMLPDPAWFPAAANKRGMAEFVVPQGVLISVIGLRAKSDGTLTTIPVLTK